jgi:hypothetical protein
MFVSNAKVQEAVREFFDTAYFDVMLGEKLTPLLAKSDVTSAMGKKLDDFFSSSIVLHKIHSHIDESMQGSGKQIIEKNLPAIFTHPELKNAIITQTAVAMKQVMDRSSQQSVVNHLAEPEVKTWIRESLILAVAAAFEHSDIHAQIMASLEDMVLEETQDIVTKLVQSHLDGAEIRQACSRIVDAVINDNVKASFPRLVKVERLDGSISKPLLVHEKFEAVLNACAVPGANILMVGPAGSGKTQIAMDVATALNRPFYFNGPVQSEYKLLGFRDATGNYSPTPFYNAFNAGGVYLFDEIDASSPQALVAFNTAIANRYCDFPSAGEPVQASDDFLCLAAANTFGRGANHDYVGRNQLDAATLDRFIVIEIDYDEKMEERLASNGKWVEKIQKWRQRARSLNVRHVISMRASITGSHLLKKFSEQEVEDMVVWRGLDRNTVAKIKAT